MSIVKKFCQGTALGSIGQTEALPNTAISLPPNGTKWKQTNITTGSFGIFHYANGVWVAADSQGTDGGVWYSTDGVNWTQSFNANFLIVYSLDCHKGVWVLATGEGVYYSLNGKEWLLGNSSPRRSYGAVYANGVWVASTNNVGMYYSDDGMTWAQSNITTGYFYEVTNANGVWVAGSNNTGLYYSNDGKTWTQSNVTSGSFGDIGQPLIVCADGMWVTKTKAVGGVYYSTDGMNWSLSDMITTYGGRCVTCENGVWVVGITNGGLYYSTDGMTWSASNITSGTPQEVVCANGTWVAATFDGLYYSDDGMTWNLSNVSENRSTAVCYACGVWVAGNSMPQTNDGNPPYYSYDGKTWNKSNITANAVHSFAWVNGIWLAGWGRKKGLYYSKSWPGF